MATQSGDQNRVIVGYQGPGLLAQTKWDVVKWEAAPQRRLQMIDYSCIVPRIPFRKSSLGLPLVSVYLERKNESLRSTRNVSEGFKKSAMSTYYYGTPSSFAKCPRTPMLPLLRILKAQGEA